MSYWNNRIELTVGEFFTSTRLTACFAQKCQFNDGNLLGPQCKLKLAEIKDDGSCAMFTPAEPAGQQERQG